MFGPSPHRFPHRHPVSCTSASRPCAANQARTASGFLLFPREKHELPIQIVTFTIGLSLLLGIVYPNPASAQQ